MDDDRLHTIYEYPESVPLKKGALIGALYPENEGATEWTSIFYEGRVTQRKFVGRGRELISIRFTSENEKEVMVPRENIIFFR